MNLFIYKPKGSVLSDSTLELLTKKYKHGSMVATYKDENTWFAPKTTNAPLSLTNELNLFNENVESVIYLTDIFISQQKRVSFVTRREETNSWSIYLPSILPSFDGSVINSMKYPFAYEKDSSQSLFYDIFLKNLSNISQLRLLESLFGRDKSESVLILNGAVHFIAKHEYLVDGVTFSNLEHENDLNSEDIKIITLSLSLFNFLQNTIENGKENKEELAKLPHRQLKEMVKSAGLVDFCKSFGLTIP